jgi:hypothetical protein
VDPTTGDYETNRGEATAVSEVSVGFIDLDDTDRLSLILSATDVAGHTTVVPCGPLSDATPISCSSLE